MPRSSALIATVLTLCVALSACSSGSDPADEPEGTGSPSASGDPSGSATPTEPVEDAAPIMVGDRPHRPACRLFTPEDAAELLPLANGAAFTQEALSTSVTVGDGPDPDAVDPSLATTSCLYTVGDADNTTVRVEVKEYADERTPRARWKSLLRFGERRLPPGLQGGSGGFDELDAALQAILEDAQASIGGVRVPGFDERILWRAGSTEFVATTDNLFLTVDRGASFGLTSTITKRNAALAERVLVRAMERAADPETPSTPVPPLFEQADDWPTFLDPCAILDADAAETLLGRPTDLLRTTSVDAGPDAGLGSESAAGRSTQNRCEREVEGSRGTAELFVQYVAAQDTAEDVLDSYLGNFAFSDPTPSRRQVDEIRASLGSGRLSDVDASYLLVLSGEESSYRSYILLDRYVLELRGYLPKGKYDVRSVDTLSLQRAAELVAANLATAIADGAS